MLHHGRPKIFVLIAHGFGFFNGFPVHGRSVTVEAIPAYGMHFNATFQSFGMHAPSPAASKPSCQCACTRNAPLKRELRPASDRGSRSAAAECVPADEVAVLGQHARPFISVNSRGGGSAAAQGLR
jgi:hypothetical protein